MLTVASFCDLLTHNPLFTLTFIFWIISGWSSSHVLLKLVQAGYGGDVFGSGRLIARLPRKYLEVRVANAWSPWPAYLVWISAIGGFVSLVASMFRFIP